MASICKIRGKWRALIRKKGRKPICKTFEKKAEAEAWARKIEVEIDGGRPVHGDAHTISQVIQAYRELRDHSRPIADTSNEHYMLKYLSQGLGKIKAGAINAQDLVAYCHMRKEEGAGPYTINMEMSKLGTVMRYGAAALKVALPDAVGQARPLLKHLGLIGSGGKRERRTNEDELPRLVEWLTANKGKIYGDAVQFAVRTAMRRGELTRILWDDVDKKKKLVLIRDRKDPRKKSGNDEWVPLLGDTWDLLQAQKQTDDPRIFPIHPQTLSKYFKAACDALGIPDLHLHDLRHEGTSQLFEQGFDIQEVSLVTGHKDWRHLKRYANLRPEDLHKKKR